MKRMKKVMALMVAIVMAAAMSVTAFAQTVELSSADADNATITINNPAKGETYSIYKLFDATVAGGKIAYQSSAEIPTGLTAFFEKDSSNNVLPKDAIKKEDGSTEMTEELKDALEAWAKGVAATNTATSDGSKLEFTGLPYGYYVVLTSHESDPAEGEAEAKSAITVTSTQPNAEINDKNVNEPSVTKTVAKESYSIGDTVEYTATFDTSNYLAKEGEEATNQVINYEISDTLPEFLSNVEVTSITIGGTDYKDKGEVPQFVNKKIMIPWATKAEEANDDGTYEYTSNYAQGAQIVIKYKAVLTSTTNINAVDTNTITIQPYTYSTEPGTPDDGKPWDETWSDTAEITTYAAAIKKVDGEKNALAGATFKIAGLTVEAVEGEEGVYRVVSYVPNSNTESMEMSTDENGKLYILGLDKDVKLTVTEFKAPDGYNKLTETKELSVQQLSSAVYETSGERHYDKDGNLVSESSTETTTEMTTKNLSDLDAAALEIENNQGSLLPSTGGIGTTIFYIVGGILVVGAAILLVTKKRMSKEA